MNRSDSAPTVRAPDVAKRAEHRALRFLTAGSVDDGKSTLIGRLLFDSRAILADQLDTLEKRAARRADRPVPADRRPRGRARARHHDRRGLPLLRHARQRKFIIADAPGHEQYTRNMVTAAAGSDAAVVLVDITKLDTGRGPVQAAAADAPPRPAGAAAARAEHCVRDQQARRGRPTRRRPSARCARRCWSSPRSAGIDVAGVVPVSALRGDNVDAAARSSRLVRGPVAAAVAREPAGAQERHDGDLLLPVQYVAREGEGTGNQPRTLWGRIAHGRVQAGDAVQLFPSGQTRHRGRGAARRRRWSTTAEAGQSAGVVLDRQLDVSRGDWIATPETVHADAAFSATLAWLDTEPAVVGRKYWVRHGNRWMQARITAIDSRLDIHTLEAIDAHELAVNEIGHVIVETQQPLPVEAYETNRVGGALIVVDPASNRTSGALLVKAAAGCSGPHGPGRLHRRRAGRGRPDHAARRAPAGQADVVLFDALTDPALRELAPRARWIDVGKRGFCPDSTAQATINALLVKHAGAALHRRAAQGRRPERVRPARRGTRSACRRRHRLRGGARRDRRAGRAAAPPSGR